MPTLYKPILTEAESIWSAPAKAISDQVFENRDDILERLNFHEVHGRLGEAGGKFDEQIKRAQDEVLAEISGILAFAAARAAEPQTGVIITLYPVSPNGRWPGTTNAPTKTLGLTSRTSWDSCLTTFAAQFKFPARRVSPKLHQLRSMT
jgi:hypothetical protein